MLIERSDDQSHHALITRGMVWTEGGSVITMKSKGKFTTVFSRVSWIDTRVVFRLIIKLPLCISLSHPPPFNSQFRQNYSLLSSLLCADSPAKRPEQILKEILIRNLASPWKTRTLHSRARFCLWFPKSLFRVVHNIITNLRSCSSHEIHTEYRGWASRITLINKINFTPIDSFR